jgi:hypothetical protein
MTTEAALQRDIEEHRLELAQTVDALAAKLDVKARLKARAAELRPMAVPALGVVAALVALLVVKRRRS